MAKDNFKKFKKGDFVSNCVFLDKVIIRIDKPEMLEKFRKTIMEDMTKKEFRLYDKIKIVGKDENQILQFKCKKTKLKKVKETLDDAKMSNVSYVDIVMVDGICQDLDEDDAELVAKIIKKTSKRFDALVKMKKM